MKVLKIRDAKARFSGIVTAAEKGQPTLITRHGQPSAMVVPVERGRQLYGPDRLGFVDFLMAMPVRPPAIKRNRKPLRDVAL